MNTKLTDQAVMDLFRECLPDDNELTETQIELLKARKPVDGYILVDGIQRTFVFNAERVRENSEKIRSLLAELPETFRSGDSFLNACMDANGQWAGSHRCMDDLFCLGIASGHATMLTHRKIWDRLPGGMPYFSVNV